MASRKRAFLVGLFLCIFVLAGSAYALPFYNEDARVALHLSDENTPTDEVFLVIKNSEHIGPFSKAKLKGFRLMGSPSNASPDFDDLDLGDDLSFFQIDTKKTPKYIKKLEKKAIQKGKDEAWIWSKIAAKNFKVTLWDENGKKYKAKARFGTFVNPGDNSVGSDTFVNPGDNSVGSDTFVNPGDNSTPNNGAASVPEPTTMLLLGTGLLGIAVMRRRFK